MNIWTKLNTGKVLVILVIMTCILILPLVKYILSEFIFCVNTSSECSICKDNSAPNRTVPLYIHQIFFFITDDEIPEKFRKAQQSWGLRNPEFKYILWNSSMIDQLIDEKFPEMKELYLSYDHWPSRADIARILTLYQYGGVYVDIDVGCETPLRNLISKMNNTSVLLSTAKPFGVSNDFIIAEEKSPFLLSAIRGLKNAKRWFLLPHFTVMFSTGPAFISGRYYNYKRKREIHIVPRDELEDNYISRKAPGCSWYRWDSFVIMSIVGHGSSVSLLRVLISVICVSLAIILLRKCIKFASKVQSKETSADVS